jgi:hypothetical protein
VIFFQYLLVLQNLLSGQHTPPSTPFLFRFDLYKYLASCLTAWAWLPREKLTTVSTSHSPIFTTQNSVLCLNYNARSGSDATGREKAGACERGYKSTCTTVSQLPAGDRIQQWIDPAASRRPDGKIPAGHKTGSCE